MGGKKYNIGFHGIGENKEKNDDNQSLGTLLHKYQNNISIVQGVHVFYGVKFSDYLMGIFKQKGIEHRYSYYGIHNPWSDDLECTKKSIIEEVNKIIYKNCDKDCTPECIIYGYSQGSSIALEFALKWSPYFFPNLLIQEVHLINGFYLEAMLREKMGPFSRLIDYKKAIDASHLKNTKFYITYVKNDHLVSVLQLYEIIKLLCDLGVSRDYIFIKIIENNQLRRGHFIVQPFVSEHYICLNDEAIKKIMPSVKDPFFAKHQLSTMFRIFCVIYAYYAL